MRVFKPLDTPIKRRGERWAFLCGSIEMGGAVPWQDEAVALLERLRTVDVVCNPRRDDWDSSWVQSIENDQFRRQVEWELCCLEKSDAVLVCFDPATKSPITLLELGLLAGWTKPTAVYCPHGFWRKGNVDIVCRRYGLEQHSTLVHAVSAIGRLADEAPLLARMEE